MGCIRCPCSRALIGACNFMLYPIHVFSPDHLKPTYMTKESTDYRAPKPKWAPNSKLALGKKQKNAARAGKTPYE